MSTNPHESVLAKLRFLSTTATTAKNNAQRILTVALQDAVNLSNETEERRCPAILTRPGLIDIQNLVTNLASIEAYYAKHIRDYEAAIGEQGMGLSTAATPTIHPDAETTTDRLAREIAEEAAARRAAPAYAAYEALQRNIPDVAPVALPDGTPTVSGARAAAAAAALAAQTLVDPAPGIPPSLSSTLAARRQQLAGLELDVGSSTGASMPVTSLMGLHAPADQGVAATSAGLPPVRTPSVLTPESLQPTDVPKDSLQILFGPASPLLDIFAAGPWLPNGRGLVTVGSKGMRWHKDTNPLNVAPADLAQLPAGFYGGENVPAYVLLRLKTSIVLWGFRLDPDQISVYMVGASDTDRQHPRWFSPITLTATYTARLLKELTDYALGIQTAK